MLFFLQHESLEVALEEERTKELMLTERASKMEQQLSRFDAIDKQRGLEMEQTKSECAQAKAEIKSLTDELNEARNQNNNLKNGKRDAEERERQLQTQSRSLAESVKKMQRQLEETKVLMKIVQSERQTISKENEDLRSELNQHLSSLESKHQASSHIGRASPSVNVTPSNNATVGSAVSAFKKLIRSRTSPDSSLANNTVSTTTGNLSSTLPTNTVSASAASSNQLPESVASGFKSVFLNTASRFQVQRNQSPSVQQPPQRAAPTGNNTIPANAANNSAKSGILNPPTRSKASAPTLEPTEEIGVRKEGDFEL